VVAALQGLLCSMCTAKHQTSTSLRVLLHLFNGTLAPGMDWWMNEWMDC